MVKYKSGILVQNLSDITSYIKSNVDDATITDLSCDLLESHIPMSRETRSNLISILINFCSRTSEVDLVDKILLRFKTIVALEWFSYDYLVDFLNLTTIVIQSERAQSNLLSLIIELIIARHNDISDNSHRLSPFLDFRLATKATPNSTSVIESLAKIAMEKFSSSDSWAAMTILSFCRGINPELVTKILLAHKIKFKPEETSADFGKSQDLDRKRVNFAAACDLYVATVDTKDANTMDEIGETLMAGLQSSPSSISVLRSFDFYLSKNSKSQTRPKLDDVYPKICRNLSHYNRHIRRTTLSILKSLSLSEDEIFMFSNLYNAEQILVDLQNYREKLNHLRKVASKDNLKSTDAFSRYLIGCLFINFNLLTPEVKKMLTSDLERCFEINQSATREFILETLSTSMKLEGQNSQNTHVHSSISSQQFDLEAFYSSKAAGQNEKPDFFAFREKIWSVGANLSSFLEPKSRILIPLFFDFIADEYHRDIKYQDLSLEVVETTNQNTNRAQPKGSKNTKKMMVYCLNLIARFNNPSKLYREPELMQLYLQLLQSTDSELQKAALDCMISYKKSPAAKYSEVLKDLADEKSFKNTFKKLVIKEDGAEDFLVKEHDEDAVFNIALRIGFGKMISKVAPGSAGGGGAAERQKFVIRNLALAKARHLSLFYDLALKPVHNISSCNVTKQMPLGKQLGVLQTIQVLLKSVNWALETVPQLQPQLLDSILSFGSNASTVLKSQLITRPKFINQLREIRTESIKALITFSDCTSWKFGGDVEENIFSWLGEMIQRLPNDSLDSPSPLLRLIKFWSTSVDYKHLMFKSIDDTSLLQIICKMLKPDIVSSTVAILIMEIVSTTLFAKDSEDEDTEMVDSALKELRDRHLAEITPILLGYFKSILSAGKKVKLNKEMLDLVVHLATEVDNSEMSNEIAWLLLHQLQSGTTYLLTEMLQAMSNLLKKITDNDKLCSELVSLTGTLHGHDKRALLVQSIYSIGETLEKYRPLHKALKGLNSIKKTFGDPVDYDARLEVLADVTSQVQSGNADFNVDLLFWKAIVLNCLYMYQQLTDLSIQTACSRLLILIMKAIPFGSDSFQILINQNILPAVRKMLKHKDEKTRFEFLQILSEIVDIYKSDLDLGQLSCLRDEENIDQDFFSNATHLQYHKRQRAYNKAVKAIEDGQIDSKIAEKYLFPLAICTLKDQSLLRQTQLLNSAMDLVVAVANKMSWGRFKAFFDLQIKLANQKTALGAKDQKTSSEINKEEQQKLNIRIIIKLISAIHWPIENVSTEFKIEMNKISNLNYSDQSQGQTKFHIIEAKPKPIRVGPQTNDNLPKEETTLEIDGKTNEIIEKSEETQKADDDLEDEELPEEDDDDDEEMEVDEKEGPKHSMELLQKIYRYFHLNIRPKLYKLISPPRYVEPGADPESYNERTIRIPVASALVQLLIRLGPEVIRSYCPGVILKLVDLLRSRDFNQREASRKALLGALDELGDGWFHVFLDELKSGLQRGYQRHVLIASLHQGRVIHRNIAK